VEFGLSVVPAISRLATLMPKNLGPKELEYVEQLIRRGRPIPEHLEAAAAVVRERLAPDDDELRGLPHTPELEDIYEVTYLAGKTAAENRALYPEVAAAADEMRKFFPNARVIALVKDRATSQ
jgi:hypothetical protein